MRQRHVSWKLVQMLSIWKLETSFAWNQLYRVATAIDVGKEIIIGCDVCNKQAKGLPHTNGFLQTFYNHPAAFCYKIPPNISHKVGALAEPLAVVVHATRRAGLKIGQGVLVTGAGTMGLLTMLVAKAYGASHVVIVDINEARLELAKKLGADLTILLGRGDDPENIGKEDQKWGIWPYWHKFRVHRYGELQLELQSRPLDSEPRSLLLVLVLLWFNYHWQQHPWKKLTWLESVGLRLAASI